MNGEQPRIAEGAIGALLSAVLPAAAAWGIVPARRDDAARTRYEAWLAEGLHGGMPCLTDYAHVKFDPSRVLPAAASLILVALPYGDVSPGSQEGEGDHGRLAGLVARVSRGRDYHKVMQTILRRLCAALQTRFPDGHFRPVCDTVPLSERSYAARAGLGTVLHNCLLGNARMGTRFVLGAVVSTREFPVQDAGLGLPQNPCAGCGRCLSVCPTRALIGPGRLDVARCIAWLTIEHKGLVDPGLWPAIGQRIFGCDACQDVCPLNRADRVGEGEPSAVRTIRDAGDPAILRPAPDTTGTYPEQASASLVVELGALFATANAPGAWIPLIELLGLVDDAEVRACFAGTALIRAGRRGLVRNAIIAWSNSGADPSRRPARGEACRDLIAGLTADPDPIVAKTARQALLAR